MAVLWGKSEDVIFDDLEPVFEDFSFSSWKGVVCWRWLVGVWVWLWLLFWGVSPNPSGTYGPSGPEGHSPPCTFPPSLVPRSSCRGHWGPHLTPPSAGGLFPWTKRLNNRVWKSFYFFYWDSFLSRRILIPSSVGIKSSLILSHHINSSLILSHHNQFIIQTLSLELINHFRPWLVYSYTGYVGWLHYVTIFEHY